MNINKLLASYLFLFSIGAFAAPADKAVSDFFKGKTKIENPVELRDPFKAPHLKKEAKEGKSGFKGKGTGQYTNLQEVDLGGLNLQQLKVVGVLIGKERRALVKLIDAKDKNAIIVLREGEKIGSDDAELKAILPGGIILVERIVNVYGQEEYLETVIPISR